MLFTTWYMLLFSFALAAGQLSTSPLAPLAATYDCYLEQLGAPCCRDGSSSMTPIGVLTKTQYYETEDVTGKFKCCNDDIKYGSITGFGLFAYCKCIAGHTIAYGILTPDGSCCSGIQVIADYWREFGTDENGKIYGGTYLEPDKYPPGEPRYTCKCAPLGSASPYDEGCCQGKLINGICSLPLPSPTPPRPPPPLLLSLPPTVVSCLGSGGRRLAADACIGESAPPPLHPPPSPPNQCTSYTPPAPPYVDSDYTPLCGDAAVQRGMQWVDAELVYCQAAYCADDTADPTCWANLTKPADSINHHNIKARVWEPTTTDSIQVQHHRCIRKNNVLWNAFRSDCSGFVTWAWGLPPIGTGGYITGAFAPYSSKISTVIPVRDLQPGDAMNEIPNVRHIIIFIGWNDVKEETKNIRTAQFMHESSCESKRPFAYSFTTIVNISDNGMSATLPKYFVEAPYRAIRSNACGTPDQRAASTAVSAKVQLNAGVGPAALLAKLYSMASNIGSALNQDLMLLLQNGASQRRKLLQVLSPNVTVLPSCSADASVSASPQSAGSLVYGGTTIEFDVSCNASGFEQVSVNTNTGGTITAPLNATLTLPYTLVFVDDSDTPTSPGALAAYMQTIIQTAFANPALHLPSFSAFARNVSGAHLFLDTLSATTPTVFFNVSLVYPVIAGNSTSNFSSTSTSSEYSAPSPPPNASKGLWGIKQLTPFIAEVVGGGIGFCLLLCICLQIRRCGGRKGGGARWWRVPAVIPSTA